MILSEADIRRMDEAMRDAAEALKQLKEQNAVLVRMLLAEKTRNEELCEALRSLEKRAWS